MDTLGQRIIRRRNELGLSPRQVAVAAGIAYSTLKDIEHDRQRSSTKVAELARALKMSAHELATGEPDRTAVISNAPPQPFLRPIAVWDNPDDLPDDEFVNFPKLDYYLSAGHGGPDPDCVEQTDKAIVFRADYVKLKGWKRSTIYTMRCQGDSMEPTIQHGAPVVIDTSATNILTGRVYAVLIDGQPLLKRLDKLPGGLIRVRSDNPMPQHAAYDVHPDAIRIIGRAVWTPVEL